MTAKQLQQHHGGGAPDGSTVEFEERDVGGGPDRARARFPRGSGRIEDLDQRGVEDARRSPRALTTYRGRACGDADDRGDVKAAAGRREVRKLADHLDLGRANPDFLVRLAQRRSDRRLAGIEDAAGKGDIAAMGSHPAPSAG